MKSSSSEPFPYEFGGPVGTAASTLLLPPLIMVLSHWAAVGHVDLAVLQSWPALRPILFPTTDAMLLLQCGCGLVLWFLALVLLWVVLPGPVVQGSPVVQAAAAAHKKEDKPLRLSYKLNGHLSFWIVVAALVVLRPNLNDYLFRYFDTLAFTASVLTSVLSVYFYLGSFAKGKVHSYVGNSGNLFHDFWMGRELNPRINLAFLSNVPFDWKQFA